MSKLQKFTKTVSGSFNDQEHITRYIQTGVLPKIHENFRHVIKQYACEAGASMDLGSCIGMICLALEQIRNSPAVGIEGNKYDFDRALTKDGKIFYYNFYVNRENFSILLETIKKHNIKLVTARRVLSEIGLVDTTVVTDMAKLFWEAGVNKMIVEGRAKTKNPQVALYSTDLEIAALKPYYVQVARYKEVSYLEKVFQP